jgi:hypothetical protein
MFNIFKKEEAPWVWQRNAQKGYFKKLKCKIQNANIKTV